jgi:hypothetical protein
MSLLLNSLLTLSLAQPLTHRRTHSLIQSVTHSRSLSELSLHSPSVTLSSSHAYVQSSLSCSVCQNVTHFSHGLSSIHSVPYLVAHSLAQSTTDLSFLSIAQSSTHSPFVLSFGHSFSQPNRILIFNPFQSLAHPFYR